MLQFPGVFLLLALIAGTLGFGDLAGGVSEFFKTLFFVLMALAALACLRNRVRDASLDSDVDPRGGRPPVE